MTERYEPQELLDRFDDMLRTAMFRSEEDVRTTLQKHGFRIGSEFTDLIGSERFRRDRTPASKRQNILEFSKRRETLAAAAAPFDKIEINILDNICVNWLARDELSRKMAYDILFFPPGSRRIPDYEEWHEGFSAILDSITMPDAQKSDILQVVNIEEDYYESVQWRRFSNILGLEQLADMLSERSLPNRENVVDVINQIIASNRERLDDFRQVHIQGQTVLDSHNAQIIAEAYPYRLKEVDSIAEQLNNLNKENE